MKNYSAVFAGVIAMIGLPMLVNVGFSDTCSNEIVTILGPMIPGAILTLWGRIRLGGVNMFGYKE